MIGYNDASHDVISNIPEILRKDVASVRASIDLSTRVPAASAATVVISGMAGPPALPTDDPTPSIKLWLSLSTDAGAVAALIEDLLSLLNDSRRIMEEKARSSGGGLPVVDQHLASSIVSTIIFVTTSFVNPAIAPPSGRIRQALRKWREELAGRTKKAVLLPNEAFACACLHRRAVAGDDLCRTMLLSSALCHRADTVVVAPPCPITLQRSLYAVNSYPFAWQVVAEQIAQGSRLDVPYDTIVHLLVQLPSLRRTHPTLSASIAQTLLLQLEQLLHLHPVPDPAFMLEALPPILAIASSWPSPVGPAAADVARYMEAEVASPGFCARRRLLREFPLLLRRGGQQHGDEAEAWSLSVGEGKAHPSLGKLSSTPLVGSPAAVARKGDPNLRAGEEQTDEKEDEVMEQARSHGVHRAQSIRQPMNTADASLCHVEIRLQVPDLLQLEHGAAAADELERADMASRRFAEAVRTVPVLSGGWDPFMSGLMHAWAAEDLGDKDACEGDEDDDVGALQLFESVSVPELRARLSHMQAPELRLASSCCTTGLATSLLEDGLRLNLMESIFSADLSLDVGGLSGLVASLPSIDWQRWLAQSLAICEAGLHGPLPVQIISPSGGISWSRAKEASPLDEAINAHRWRAWHLMCCIADMSREQHHQLLGFGPNGEPALEQVTASKRAEADGGGEDSDSSSDSDSSNGDGTPIMPSGTTAHDILLSPVDLEGCVVDLWTKWARHACHRKPHRWSPHVVEEVRGLVFGESQWYLPPSKVPLEPEQDPEDQLNSAVPLVPPPPLRLASMPLPLGLVADMSEGRSQRQSRSSSSASAGRIGSQDSQHSMQNHGRSPGAVTTLESLALTDSAANASLRLDRAVASLVELVDALCPGESGSSASDDTGEEGQSTVQGGEAATGGRQEGGSAPPMALPIGAATPRPDDVKTGTSSRGPYCSSAVIRPTAEVMILPLVVAGNDIAVHAALTAIAKACALHRRKMDRVEWRLFVIPSPPGTHCPCLVHPSGRGEPLPSFASPKGISSSGSSAGSASDAGSRTGRVSTGVAYGGGGMSSNSPASGSLAAQAARALSKNSLQVGSRDWRLHHAIQAQCTLPQWLAVTDPWYCREVFSAFSQDSVIVPRIPRQLLCGPSYSTRHSARDASRDTKPRVIVKHAFESSENDPTGMDQAALASENTDDTPGQQHPAMSLAQRAVSASSNGCGGLLGEEDVLSCGYVSGSLGLRTPLASMRGLLHSYLRNAGRSTPLKLFQVELELASSTSTTPISHPSYQSSESAREEATSKNICVLMFSSLEIGFRANAAWDQAKRFEESEQAHQLPSIRGRSASVTERLASGVAAAVGGGAESRERHASHDAFRDDVLVSPERIEQYRKTQRHLTAPVRLSAAAPRDSAGSYEPADLREVLRQRLMTLRFSALPTAADLAHQEQEMRKERQAQELSEAEGGGGKGADEGAITPQQAEQVGLAAQLVREAARLPEPGNGYVAAKDLRKMLSGVGTKGAKDMMARQKKAASEKRPLSASNDGSSRLHIASTHIATMESPWLVMAACDATGPTCRSINTSVPSGPQLLDSLITEEASSSACVMAASINIESEDGRGKSKAQQAGGEGIPVLIDGELVPSLVKRIRIEPMQDAPRVSIAHFM